jgi:hypothetical protein
MTLIKEVKLQGKTYKDLRKKFGDQTDWELQEEQTVEGEILPKGYWVYVKNELPQIAEETEKGVRVRVGISTLTQTAKAVASAPKLYIWKEVNPNPPSQPNNRTDTKSSFASSSGAPFKYQIWFPGEGYYDVSSIQGMQLPKISGTVKIETDAYFFQEIKMSFEYPEYDTEVTIGIDGLGRNDMPMKFPLGAGARAVVTGFSLREGNNVRPITISSEPTYAGTDNTGLLVIESYDKAKKTISGYFEFTCQMAGSTHKAKGSFKNIALRRVEW